jgi:hypothetical protein
MATSTEDRDRLTDRLHEVLGRREATTLVELISPIDWAEMATKADVSLLRGEIDGVEERLGTRIDGVEERFALRLENTEHRIRTELYQGLAGIQREMRVQGFSILGGVSLVVAVATALGRLL